MAESAREKRIQNELRVVARIIENASRPPRTGRRAQYPDDGWLSDRLSGRHLRHPKNCYTNR